MLKQKRIAVIVETSKGHGRGLLRGIGMYARGNRTWAVHMEERGLMDPIPGWFNFQDFDGVLLRSPDPAAIRRFVDSGVPTVYLGSGHRSDLLTVAPDQPLVAAAASEHLLEQGFTQFAYIGIDGYVWADSRRDAFTAQIAKAGFDCHVFAPASNTTRRPDWGAIQRDTADWILRLPRPIGIMCANDAMARAVLDVCRKMEVAVPEECAIVGVDNDELVCEFNDPALTSVDLNTHRIGFTAAESLDQLMQGDVQIATTCVPPMGIVSRQSTDTIAIEDPRIAAALGFIRRFACDGINVSDVLNSVPLSRSTLERGFKNAVGRTPLSELRRVRLHRVKLLLEQTDLKLDAIAQQCGFAHTPHMIHEFSGQFGRSPGQFRKSLQAPGD